jgi:hypothetical protein
MRLKSDSAGETSESLEGTCSRSDMSIYEEYLEKFPPDLSMVQEVAKQIVSDREELKRFAVEFGLPLKTPFEFKECDLVALASRFLPADSSTQAECLPAQCDDLPTHETNECGTNKCADEHPEIETGRHCENETCSALNEETGECSSSNDLNKVCDCCYCEVFGYGMSSVAPTSRNFSEMRDRLRNRLSKKKVRNQTSSNVNHDDCSESVELDDRSLDERKDAFVQTLARKDLTSSELNELLDFVNGGQKAGDVKKNKRKERRKRREKKANGTPNDVQSNEYIASVGDKSDKYDSDADEPLRTLSKSSPDHFESDPSHLEQLFQHSDCHSSRQKLDSCSSGKKLHKKLIKF